MTRITTLDLPTFTRSTIGFDRLFDELHQTFANSPAQSYPPYNIAAINEDEYMVSLAVAGFAEEDLTVKTEKGVLVIEGTKAETDTEVTYLHKGIGSRNFTREFKLADHVEVAGARLELGVLNIHRKREVPEEMKPKMIKIVSDIRNALS